MKIEIPHIESLADVLIDHLDFFCQKKCFAFVGEMGAGKTTIIQRILNLNGVKNLQGSPTYSIINEYETEEGMIFYHLDCYRIKNNAEAFELGIEELLSKKNPIFIEWPKKINAFLPSDTIWVHLEVSGNHTRIIEIADEHRS